MFIDTSGWANLYIPSETYHPLTAQIFQESRQQQQQLFTSSYVVSELVALLDSPLRTSRNRLFSLVDCSSFIIMQQLDIQTVLTTDRHFEQAGFTRLLK